MRAVFGSFSSAAGPRSAGRSTVGMTKDHRPTELVRIVRK
jgi:hypothetical protein